MAAGLWKQSACLSPPIIPGEVHVWRIVWEKNLAYLTELERNLSQAERIRAGAFCRAEDRHRFLVGRAVLCICSAAISGDQPATFQ